MKGTREERALRELLQAIRSCTQNVRIEGKDRGYSADVVEMGDPLFASALREAEAVLGIKTRK